MQLVGSGWAATTSANDTALGAAGPNREDAIPVSFNSACLSKWTRLSHVRTLYMAAFGVDCSTGA